MTQPWYQAENLRQRVSGFLTAWRPARSTAQQQASPQAATSISEGGRGSDIYNLFTGGAGGGAGVPVTEQTAMSVSAVYACVALIGGAISALPFHIYKRTEQGRERYDSELWWLFNESPWSNWTAASAWQFAAQSIALRGDGYWRIRRVTPYTNQIEGFEPLHPNRVMPRRIDGQTVYQVTEEDGRQVVIPAADMLHFHGIGFDGLRSLTPLQSALRTPASIALAADEYASSFFRNGARPDFVLKSPGKLTPDAADLVRETWANRHSGPYNAHLPAILSGGLEVQQLTMSAEDAQLLATRKFQVEDIARIFGVAPHMIGAVDKSTSWGTGIEQQAIGFRAYTLGRYLDVMRQEINRKIWPRSKLFFAEHNRDALLDGDSAAQAAYFNKALGGPGAQGWMTINEVRKLKNLPPVPDGDMLMMAGAAAKPAPTEATKPIKQDNS